MTDSSPEALELGAAPVSVENLVRVARGQLPLARLGPELETRLAAGAARLTEQLALDGRIYGVTTGFGASCQNDVERARAESLALNLFRFHGCGTGRPFSREESVAILVARIISLARGYSAVRPELVNGLVELVRRGVVPRIPEEGSVGASGDLTPLSYIAAVLAGEREVWSEDGESRPAGEALASAGLEPFAPGPKESLAIMNGTSAMTGVAALCLVRARRLARLAAGLTAMACEAVRGEPAHFAAPIFAAKPHPGQTAFAGWLRADLEGAGWKPERLQDRYSLRCAPHVVGVLLDAWSPARQWVEVEMNGVSDNPLIDPDTGDVHHGGNFYGGHVAHAMDSMKTCAANVADLLDRQLALLCNETTSGGLPDNLVALDERFDHHGFKAMQITASALTAEALKLTMPASVFSRSTENHNQDKVSMGLHSARDCRRILDLTETVAVIHLLALAQAIDLRGGATTPRAKQLHAAVRQVVPKLTDDRRMDVDIDSLLALLRADSLPLGQDVFDA